MDTYEKLKDQVTDRGPWQQLGNGHAFYPCDPKPEECNLYVIAGALSRICRYNGHLRRDIPLYSVAQHGWEISRWMEADGHSPELCFKGLHHDSGEAYYGDFISQIKWAIPEIKPFTAKIDAAVDEYLGITWTEAERALIKYYDFIAFATEKRDVLEINKTNESWGELPDPWPKPIEPMTQQKARGAFLDRHYELQLAMGVRK